MAEVEAVPTSPATDTDVLPGERRWWRRLEPVAWAVWGGSLAVLLAVDGSPAWQLARPVAALLAAAGGWCLARSRHGWSAVASLVGGSIAIAAGGAVGIRLALADGPTLRSLAGVTLLAAGLALVVAGGAEVLHRVRRWQRVLVLPGLVIGVGLVVFVVGPGVLATNVPRIDDGPRTPADLGIAFEDVEMVASDGARLAGWMVPSRNGAAVVLRHGAGSTRDDTLEQLAVLAEAGFGVLATDARGHGASGGRAMDFGWYGDRDIDAALDLLVTRADVDPDRLAVVGLSMGGEEAVGAISDPRVQAVVAEGVTGRVAADKAWLSEAYGVRGMLQRGIEWLQTETTDLLTAASPPAPLASAVRAAGDTSLLLVAADLHDEVRAAAWLQEQAPERVTVWVVDGAGHTGGLRTAPDEWRSRVVGFLSAALLEGP